MLHVLDRHSHLIRQFDHSLQQLPPLPLRGVTEDTAVHVMDCHQVKQWAPHTPARTHVTRGVGGYVRIPDCFG